MTADRARRLLIAGRLVVGGGALVAPGVTGRAFGIAVDDNRAARYVARLFGVRAVFMALLLATSTGSERDRQLRAGIIVDLIDAWAALAAGRDADLPPVPASLACAAALTETALGVAASVAVDRSRHGHAGAGRHQEDRVSG